VSSNPQNSSKLRISRIFVFPLPIRCLEVDSWKSWIPTIRALCLLESPVSPGAARAATRPVRVTNRPAHYAFAGASQQVSKPMRKMDGASRLLGGDSSLFAGVEWTMHSAALRKSSSPCLSDSSFGVIKACQQSPSELAGTAVLRASPRLLGCPRLCPRGMCGTDLRVAAGRPSV